MNSAVRNHRGSPLGGRPDITTAVLAEFDLTRRTVLATLEQNELLQHKPQLRTRITLRAPDIDALSHLQLRALRLLRNKGTETDDPSDPQTRQQWAKVLLLTVKGAAAGLQNTG
ncbi:phosphoenolpyruvate carboxylase [Tessaracoccus defluvii]|uniref:Phosphoenolpyruvate carboxylase n=1 Tax=Tessaracoccus defluvii TaxID=1285901 RepID=A0A7H0HAP7_9ACTN|nr:phosphoenolpyruvate carboxylase [Tessaracoccus defluvii]QNP57613.1 phosphoenolpyruvate carboxylase [Tessaracoccus defluvii]